MSGLSDFLHPVAPEEQEVYISQRFVRHDDDGNVMLDQDNKPVLAPFRIRPVAQEVNDAITKAATKTKTVKGQTVRELDGVEYNRRLIVAGTVEPDMTSTALCQSCGTLDPLEVPGKLLLAGEYAKLLQAITELSGFDLDVQAEAKN